MPKALFIPLQLSLGAATCLSASPILAEARLALGEETSPSFLAQVTTDGTVNTQVNQNGNVAEITGGETRGSNLFHSFQDFSVPTGNEAFFDNANSISNIFSRVTGGNISNIDGLIRANGAANLFLINPAGIVFGESATLSIGGSFYGSSASSILFEDGEFSAVDNLNQPILTVNAPIGLGFRDNPGDIIYNSPALIAEGRTFALVGGNVELNSNAFVFTSLDSRLELGGLSANGEVELTENGGLVFPDDIARGDVTFNGSSIGIDIITPSERGGTVAINGRNVSLNPGSEFNNPTNINLGIPAGADASESQPGNLIINATETFALNGGSVVSQNNFGIGDTGNIEITARNISFITGGNISNFNDGQGNSGEVSLTATEDIVFDGVEAFGRSGINSTVFTGGEGNSSNINLTASNLSVIDGGSISSQVVGMGSSGAIDLNVSDSTVIEGVGEIVLPGGTITSLPSTVSSNVAVGGVGNSGNIDLNTTNLSLSNTGQISAVSAGEGNAGNIFVDANNIFLSGSGEISAIALADGNGGNITIEASNINIDGQDDNALFSSGLRSDFLGTAQLGNGGDITIATESISLINGGQIESLSNANGNSGNITITATDTVLIDGENSQGSRSNIDAQILPNAIGNAGNIDIAAANFSLTNNAIITNSSSGRGNAGSININATNNFIADDSLIVSNVGDPFGVIAASGNVGNIEITAREINFANTGQIQAGLFSNATGEPGIVSLTATDSISIVGENTGIFSSNEANSTGNASNARLDAPIITLDDGAVVEASNSGQGNGGNVAINADNLLLDRNNLISGSTVSGTGGIVNLQIAEDLTLGSGNLIAAEALNDANGGNLNIDARFIIAFPNGNNDILASSQQGRGGNISINAESLFGIQEGSLSNLTNDINASSQVSGLDGTVEITVPDVNPIQGAAELPANVVASQQITAQACAASSEAAENGLAISGKGGVPPAPNLPLNSLNAINNDETNSTSAIPIPIATTQGKIQPARGIEVTESGVIRLTAYRTNNAGDRLPEIKLNCGRV